MEIGPFEDVFPIDEKIHFHCYVSLPEYINFVSTEYPKPVQLEEALRLPSLSHVETLAAKRYESGEAHYLFKQ